ncbi:sigma-70 family RNA polymerase sigma factor [Arthrobacter crusticola]|uniref:Sigma-70 family RNA polymerase sigma factor n=1 Tax=Arthrobacter crusticola TaxID=2547960 RepID=A0A4R5TRI4_9MICC|nr:ECF RNA polymerase sigma factor SigK [Arthrobacter crusticola]TDK23593.1 sigma-70 family RNA polymerase sigma factor [Arthrobacter crusticola]
MDTPRVSRATAGRTPAGGLADDAAGTAGEPTLTDLLLRIAGQDQEAFAAFYAQTSRRVYGLARRVLIDPELSEDATQEVYLQVWNSAGRFDPAAGSPMAWLMTLAHRRAVDKVRSEQSSTDREARYGAATQTIDHDDVVDTVTQRLEAETVVKCLDTLTDTQQESVRLAYYGGLTYREVAEKLGVAVPTIKSRIRDGLIRLKACLGVS